jgi:hypothetical protein
VTKARINRRQSNWWRLRSKDKLWCHAVHDSLLNLSS